MNNNKSEKSTSINKQQQKAGDYATQVQAGTVIMGVDEKRVRQVFNEMLPLALQNYSKEAEEVARQRVGIFEEKLFQNMIKTSTIKALKDPAIQTQLVEAQKIAISTDKEQDYDMLSELMIQRFRAGKDRNKITGISKAIEAVDKLSDEALQGLTLLFAINSYTPSNGDLNSRLQILDDLYSKLVYCELPRGDEWIDSLDIHNAIRVNSLGGMIKFENIWFQFFDGFVKNGILVSSDNFKIALEKLKSVGLTESIFVENSADINYVKLNFANKAEIKKALLVSNVVTTKASDEQIQMLEEIYDLYDGSAISMEDFITVLDNYSSLVTVRDWWNNTLVKYSLQVTTVGRALAETNSQRIDSTLPKVEIQQ